MTRRRALLLAAPLLIVGAYFGVRSLVRSHVDGLIAHAIGQPLPEFTLPDSQGLVHAKRDLAGKRVVLHFFRSHCHSCDFEAPAYRALEAELPADVALLHVMTDRVLGYAADVTQRTLAAKAFTRPVLLADATFADAFHKVRWSNVTPVTYVVDATGTIRFGLRGAQSLDTLRAVLRAP